MSGPKHAPGWRGRPTSYVGLKHDDEPLTPLELYALFAGVMLAGVTLLAAAIVWAGPVADWIKAL